MRILILIFYEGSGWEWEWEFWCKHCFIHYYSGTLLPSVASDWIHAIESDRQVSIETEAVHANSFLVRRTTEVLYSHESAIISMMNGNKGLYFSLFPVISPLMLFSLVATSYCLRQHQTDLLLLLPSNSEPCCCYLSLTQSILFSL